MSHVRVSAAPAGLLWSVSLISLLWLVLSAMAIALGYWLDETTLSGLLPVQYEWELMAWELQLSAVAVVILAGPALGSDLFERNQRRACIDHRTRGQADGDITFDRVEDFLTVGDGSC